VFVKDKDRERERGEERDFVVGLRVSRGVRVSVSHDLRQRESVSHKPAHTDPQTTNSRHETLLFMS